jgi:hypothetical protein
MEELIGAELIGAELMGAELIGAAELEQSADANGMGTVSVAPASVIKVVVHPQAGIDAPVYDTGNASGLP